MSRLKQLAMDWHRQANEDLQAAEQGPLGVRQEYAQIARTRRNCAWELMRTLQTLDKENPLDGAL